MNKLRVGTMILAVAVILLIVVLLLPTYPTPRGSVSSDISSFAVNGKEFKLTYLATNQTEWTKGLMDVKITKTTTELFVFPSSNYWAFWMFGVNSSLDMIWVNATGSVGHVVYLVSSAPGCNNQYTCATYSPSSEANMVIEATGGFAAANGIVVGSTVTFD